PRRGGRNEVAHRLRRIDAAETVGAGAVSALLRRIIARATRIPVGEAVRIATRRNRARVIRGERPVISPSLADRARFARRRTGERARRDPVMNRMREFMQHDVGILGIISPAIAIKKRAVSWWGLFDEDR